MALMENTGLDWRAAFTAVAALITLGSTLYARQISQGRHFIWINLSSAALIVAGVWGPTAIWRVVLLDVAALLIAALVWRQDQPSGRLFLPVVVGGSILVAAGMALGGLFSEASAHSVAAGGTAAVALILLGFALKLAILPFSFWLPPLAGRVSPMTAVLVISLLDMAEFGELALLRVEAPWIFDGLQGIWVALALLCMYGGALLALAQTNLRRMLAFSTIDDMGYLLLGLAAGTAGGLLGALLGALSHALCKFLLFGAVGVAELDLKRPLTLDERGLAVRRPLAGAAFIAGALGMIGVPPFLGFLGRWRLYLSGIELGGPALAVAMAAATALALFYYIRAIHRVWLGRPAEAGRAAAAPLPWVRLTFLVGIAVLALVCFVPALLPGFSGR